MEKIKKGETMSFAVTINSSGQATIPKEVRDILGIIPGQNRLTFDIVDGEIVLGREPSRAELLEASLKKIWRNIEKEKKKNPEFAENYEKYKGMSFEEVRDAYDATPEGKKEFEEKYGIRL
ncbi:AbrB/MazE/SpoVT family DNA-binding domain-containing protein [Candidatus Saccharibacteria bacterium]|nr:AbrB/MazE/SpoVT family DNA-binding domain-containing protein [Candidatus Saccharibacteria bacterium]MBQ3264060.1 AbrB/MazE/SpoVT family DNA-binding domain-containing protein [Candidatus Saccharibacteria bacterium]